MLGSCVRLCYALIRRTPSTRTGKTVGCGIHRPQEHQPKTEIGADRGPGRAFGTSPGATGRRSDSPPHHDDVHQAIYSLLMMDRGFLAESINIENLVPSLVGLDVGR